MARIKKIPDETLIMIHAIQVHYQAAYFIVVNDNMITLHYPTCGCGRPRLLKLSDVKKTFAEIQD